MCLGSLSTAIKPVSNTGPCKNSIKVVPKYGYRNVPGSWLNNYLYQMMRSYFKGTADAVAEYCSAVSCPNAPNTFESPLTPHYHLRTYTNTFLVK